MRKKPLPTVVLTHPIHPEVIRDELAPHALVVIARSREALHRALPKADGLITLLTDQVTDDWLKKAPKLKVIGNDAVGVNNIDLAACRLRGIRVVNTPEVLTHATAELALALLLAAARRIPEGEALCRSGRFRGWAPDLLLGLELRGRHAVLVGKGRIGQETGRLFRAIGLTTEWITRGDSESTIHRKLGRAQVLSMHVPLTPETHHWLNSKRLSRLPAEAIVINTSRGKVIDESALIRALQRKKIFAAGLDVFEHEPRIPASLRKIPNGVLLPHLGSATRETRRAMAQLVVSGVLGILNGKRPPNEVPFRVIRRKK